MTTHITYETAKKLKEFLGEYCPEPQGEYALYYSRGLPFGPAQNCEIGTTSEKRKRNCDIYPRYQLHDLLNKPFCEAMSMAWCRKNLKRFGRSAHGTCIRFTEAYYRGGLPAVEKALIEMMEGK